ncbi:hypothetical protein A4A49_08054 [Nicotiana attenuata]|uniref:Uncharacterized protein n=1 Tax=Nicotiana attenuata TaxID=49451 RepID=A0A314L6F4_NICAT|nr:hypothetical protein A4A49_08054 [Nicotiana attenuata]
MLQFSVGRSTNLFNHPEPRSSGKGNCKNPKQGFGDVWSTTMAGSHGPEPPKSHATEHRLICPQQDATDIQQHAFLPRSISGGPLCNPTVQDPLTGIIPENFTLSARESSVTTSGETTQIASREHLQKNINNPGATEESRGANGPGSNPNRQPSEGGLTLAGSSKSGGVQRGPQRNFDTPMSKEPSPMRNGLLLSPESR